MIVNGSDHDVPVEIQPRDAIHAGLRLDLQNIFRRALFIIDDHIDGDVLDLGVHRNLSARMSPEPRDQIFLKFSFAHTAPRYRNILISI